MSRLWQVYMPLCVALFVLGCFIGTAEIWMLVVEERLVD